MDTWMIVGFLAQGLFFGRFFIQWIVSEYKGESTVPLAFWIFSVLGGSMLLVYAIHRKDPVFICGQAGGLMVYSRNLMLIYQKKQKMKKEVKKIETHVNS
ncbi:MAG: lipid-A-disaccharide synthase N-terminal domain-containing protein [Candidatus Vecturithrix sp.]|nr:lipid-A-disaccharide synthase N-terminal domain-containing protein [Candidatus Vecturithrix sp.]